MHISRASPSEGLRGNSPLHNAVARTRNQEEQAVPDSGHGLGKPTMNVVVSCNSNGGTQKWVEDQTDILLQSCKTHNWGQRPGIQKVHRAKHQKGGPTLVPRYTMVVPRGAKLHYEKARQHRLSPPMRRTSDHRRLPKWSHSQKTIGELP